MKLIAFETSAKAASRDVHHSLASRDECTLTVCVPLFTGDPRKPASGVFCFAVQGISQYLSFITEFFTCGLRCQAELTDASGYDGLYIIKILRGLMLQAFKRSFAQLKFIFLYDLNCLFACRTVRVCRSACYHVQWIPYDIA